MHWHANIAAAVDALLFTQVQASRLKELLHQFLAAYAEGELPEGCFQSRFVLKQKWPRLCCACRVHCQEEVSTEYF